MYNLIWKVKLRNEIEKYCEPSSYCGSNLPNDKKSKAYKNVRDAVSLFFVVFVVI